MACAIWRQQAGGRPETHAVDDAALPLIGWGRTDWPDGSAGSAACTAEDHAAVLQRLRVSPGPKAWLAPADAWPALLAQRRPDEPIPIAVAVFDYLVPPHGFSGDAAVAAAGALLTQRAVLAAPLLHEQWASSAVRLRSRAVRWWLDARFRLAQPEGPAWQIDSIDCGDGLGARAVPADGLIEAHYPQALDGVTVQLQGRIGGAAAQASLTIGFGPPVAPRPDLTLKLEGRTAVNADDGGHAEAPGTLWAYLALGRTAIAKPLLLAEGFPGGYACDYLHDVLNQCGMLDALRAAGYDVVLLGFADGRRRIQDNADVFISAIERLQALTDGPIVAGGMSMGGLVARWALTAMEHAGRPHRCRAFVTLDTPHQGAYTSVAAQFFADAFAGVLGGAADLAGLLNTPANRQFVKLCLERDAAGSWHCSESVERLRFVAELATLGDWPQRPLKIGLACGRGDGVRTAPPGQTVLTWRAAPWADVTLQALDDGGSSLVGQAAGSVLGGMLPPCRVESLTAWESVPGSSNVYVGIVAALAASVGVGTLGPVAAVTTSIPTVSALALDQPPDAPVPASGPERRTPFDRIACAATTLPHLGLDETLRDALLDALGPA